MDSINERKILQLSKKPESDQSAKPLSWEKEYFSKLSESAKAQNLGRPTIDNKEIIKIPVSAVEFSPFQTRELPEENDLEELKNSILSKGVIQPILVRYSANSENYELVAGERRLRASLLANLREIPAIIEDLSDQESLELSIIENAQRENLNPIEEAKAYSLLVERFKLGQNDIAKIVGKNRATVANSLRLLKLDPKVIELLRKGELSAGHGRALLMVEDHSIQLQLASLAVKKALSVRALEQLVSSLDEDSFVQELPVEDEQEKKTLERAEQKISNLLGLEKVKLFSDRQGRKKLTLTFDTEASWKRFMSRIKD